MFRSKTFFSVCPLFLLVVFFAFTSGVSAQCVPAPTGMTDWWTADNNTFDIIGGYHGTLQNGATFADGEVDQAFSLDGTNDYVLVPNDPAAPFNFSGSFTVDAWVFLDTAPAQFAPIVSKWNDIGVDHRGYFLAVQTIAVNNVPTPLLRFDVSQDGLFLDGHSALRYSASAFPVGQWTHVAGVFNGATHTLDVYINGVLSNGVAAGSTTVTTPFTTTEPLLIGAGDLGGDVRDFFDGRIDEVELFNRTLTASEIMSIFSAGPLGKTIPITIDIKPGDGDDDRNPINLGSRGKVPVAILGTETFDVTTVDVSTVVFAGAHVVERSNGTFQYSYGDVNDDGLVDLVMHFYTQDLVDLDPTSTSATLDALTTNDRCVSGTDNITIVPRRTGGTFAPEPLLLKKR